MRSFYKLLPTILSTPELLKLFLVANLSTLISLMEVTGLALIAFVVINLGDLESALIALSIFPTSFNLEIFFTEPLNYSFIFCTFIIIYSLITLIFSVLIIRYISSYSQSIGSRIKELAVTKYLSLDWDEVTQLSPSESMSRIINDSEQTGDAIFFSMHLYSKIMLAIMIIILLFAYNSTLTVLLVAILASSYFIVFTFFDSLTRANSKITASSKALIVKAVKNMFGALKEISFYRSGSQVLENISMHNARYAAAKADNMAFSQIPRFIIDSLILIMLVGLLIYMQFNSIEPAIFFATISVFGIAGLKLLPAFQNIFYFAHEINSRAAYIENISKLSLLGINIFDNFESSDELTQPSIQSLLFKNICYKYPQSKSQALKNLNISINRGEKIALFGQSGSGKSTFIDILLALIEPETGEIEINNKMVDSRKLQKFRDKFAYVPQKIYFLEGSLRDNIVFGNNKNFSEDKLDTLMRNDRLKELINNLPLGLETILSDETQLVSGGQKQLIGIIRALLRGGDILILDESTSAMDSRLEKQIYEIIFNSTFSTFISITHKSTLLKNFDQIYLFHDGEIKASGSFEELTASSALFQSMLKEPMQD